MRSDVYINPIAFESSDFHRLYHSNLIDAGKDLARLKPDYVLALSRKGPRLIELMQKYGYWVEDVPVITERALEFIDPNIFDENSRVVIFDDIIILGSTLLHYLNELVETHHIQNLFVVVIAIDVDTISKKDFEIDLEGHYWALNNDGKRIGIYPSLQIPKTERFFFCNSVVKAFTFLTKSFDVDFPLFYFRCDEYSYEDFIAHCDFACAVDVGTEYNVRTGQLHHSLFPRNIQTNFFIDRSLNLHVFKVRSYLDLPGNLVAFCPIMTFELAEDNIEELLNCFIPQLNSFNTILQEIYEIIIVYCDKKTGLQAIYKAFNYFLCYILGLSLFCSIDDLPNEFNPRNAINYLDISYIFGPKIGGIIYDFLESEYGNTVESIKSIVASKLESTTINNDEPIVTILPDLPKNVIEDLTRDLAICDSIVERFAVLFETLYWDIEIPCQERMCENGIDPDAYKRLKGGFTLPEIKAILEFFSPKNVPPIEALPFSLALDHLVDAGVVIPFFNFNRDDLIYRRTYWYGENGPAELTEKKFGNLFAKAFLDLSNFYQNPEISKIGFEKMGVIFLKFVEKSPEYNFLQQEWNQDDQKIQIYEGYGRFGMILKFSGGGDIFTEWCARREIIEYVDPVKKRKVRYNPTFLTNLLSESRLPNSPQISYGSIQDFQNLLFLLYSIECFIDKSGESSYLVALTTCDNRVHYLSAIQKSIGMFFESSIGYQFSLMLEALKEVDRIFRGPENIEEIKEMILSIRQMWGMISSIHEVRHKKHLWDDLPAFLIQIDNDFRERKEECDSRNVYGTLLSGFISSIVASRRMPEPIEVIKFTNDIEQFGEFCITISEILLALINLISNSNFEQTIFSKFNKWKDLLIGNLQNFPLIEFLDHGHERWVTDDNSYFTFFKAVAPLIEVNYSLLEKIYSAKYSPYAFGYNLNQIFPEKLTLKNIESTLPLTDEERELLTNSGLILLVTVNSTEFATVFRSMSPLPSRKDVLKMYVKAHTYYIGKLGAYFVVLVKCDSSGSLNRGASFATTFSAMYEWNPRAIIAVGVAFGVNQENQCIGDVLVSRNIINYETQRIGDSITIQRGEQPLSGNVLSNRFNNVPEWEFSLDSGNNSRILYGPILSGEKLIDSPSFKGELLTEFPEAIGGEMEGVGIAGAAFENQIEWIIVKGICDWAEHKEKNNQSIAAAAACSLVKYVLSDGVSLQQLGLNSSRSGDPITT